MSTNEWHNGKLLVGDVLEKIAEIEEKSVDCVISSPPYWGLRDYGTGSWKESTNPLCTHDKIRRKTRAERKSNEWMEDALGEGTYGDESKWSSHTCPDCSAHYEDPQWGSEPDFKDYLKKLDLLMVEMKRILKDTGTCWINLGDTYSTRSGGMRDLAEGNDKQYGSVDYTKFEGSQDIIQHKTQFRDKTRIGVPERFYISCIDNDWIARNHIVWAKANAMPSSVKDRFNNKWESVFFFAKNPRYYFDLDAVREIPLGGYAAFNRRIRDAKKLNQMGLDGAIPAARASEKEMAEYGNHQPGDRSHFGTGKDILKNMQTKYDREQSEQYASSPDRIKEKREDGADHEVGLGNPEQGKNPGDVFWINPKPFQDAHFATFPEALPERIIKCACPEGGTVFDPFMGSGTVAAVALKNNRKWIGIELNPEYVKIIKKRLDSLQNNTMESFF